MFEREVSHLFCAKHNKGMGKEGLVVALTKAVVVYTVFTMHHINSLGPNTMLHSPRIHTPISYSNFDGLYCREMEKKGKDRCNNKTALILLY